MSKALKGSDYRARLYQYYVSRHLGTFRDISTTSLERQRHIYRYQFGKWLPRDKNANILDIGCGYGAFVHFLRKEGYANVRGIDASEEQVRQAKHLGIPNVILADLREYLANHATEYDLITALDVLEHFTKPELFGVLDAIYASLRDGGGILMQSPNGDSPYVSWIYFGDFTHQQAFTRTSVTQVLLATGFREVQVLPLEPVPHGIKSATRWMLWKIIKQMIRLYLVVEQGSPGSGILTANLSAFGRK